MTQKNAILGIYYNVLCPEERDGGVRRKFYAWVVDPAHPFPLSDGEILIFSPSTARMLAQKALSRQIAKQLLVEFKTAPSFTAALEASLAWMEKTLAPRYLEMSATLQSLGAKKSSPLVRTLYELLADSFKRCGKDGRRELRYVIHKYECVQNDPERLKRLLSALADDGATQDGRLRDSWNDRRAPLVAVIGETLDAYGHIPFFFALQEVTRASLGELAHALNGHSIQWIAFDNVSHEHVLPVASIQQMSPGEASSHLATIGLSAELQMCRATLGTLPTRSGVLRTILGVEVINARTGGHFAIISTHADHVIQDHLYRENAQAIETFVHAFTQGGSLPFIFGGDLNAFDDMDGAQYIENILAQPSFARAVDYRAGPFYSPREIIDATFIGHHRDEYKMAVSEQSQVQPNALDHIFLTPEVLCGFRKAAVYDASGSLVDPAAQPEMFTENLKGRRTASDHFLNGVLFISP